MENRIRAENKWNTDNGDNGDRCWWWLASLFMAAMMALVAVSCTEDPIESGSQEPEGLPATIRLEIRPDATTQAQTRVTVENESAIKDLHILVYNSAGELCGQSYGVYSASKPSFTVSTRSGSNNTIYAIANTGNATLFNGTIAATETKLKAMTTPKLKKWDELTNASHLVMVGSRQQVKIEAGSSTLKDGITVARIAAKVTLNIGVKAGSGITITGYRVSSLPAQSYYVPNNADATTTWVSDSTLMASNVTSITKTFFMYENRRGEVKSIINQKNKGGDNVPDNASYVAIKGKANGYDATWLVYLGKNNTSDFNMERNSKYTYKITLNRPGEVDTRVVDKVSNCYMILPGSAVSIPVIRANESFIKLTGSIYNPTTNAYDQLQDSTKWTASLVWETSPGLVTISEAAGKGPWGDFKVTAKNTSTQGNAVVAIKNYKKEILWSWHIWIVNYGGATFTTNNGKRNIVFMDRALGATSVTPGDIKTCGLMYQWGRKDPFPGLAQGGSWNTAVGSDPTRVYNALGAAIEIAKKPVPNVTPNNLTNATRNPTTFYYNPEVTTDWYAYKSTANQNHDLWSGSDISSATAKKKSVFDPCPVGWRVPPWLNNTSPFAGMVNTAAAIWENYGRNWSGTGGYFPASGYRAFFSGLIHDAGLYGYSWPGAPAGINVYYYGFYKDKLYTPDYMCQRASGLPLRCIQE